MDKIIFADKYGNLSSHINKTVEVREKNYIIIKKDDELMCLYDGITGLYSFPSDEDVMLSLTPSLNFSIIAYITEDGKPYKEQQNYGIYLVDNADFADLPLHWCKINDLLLDNVRLDATQKNGFKNLLVRIDY